MAVGIDEAGIAIDELRLVVECAEKRRQLVRVPHVVLVAKGHEVCVHRHAVQALLEIAIEVETVSLVT
ncbi:hypothetical protein Acid7E03_35140 [Acidisoma sp. 7E03]